LAAAITGHSEPRVVALLGRWADDRVRHLLRLARRRLPAEHPLVLARALLTPVAKRLRVEVEARLLAGQPSAAIAAATGVRPGAVEMYHDGYYDCRPRLAATGYIRHAFLGGVPPEGDLSAPPLGLLRWVGFFGGPYALDEVLGALDPPPAHAGTTAAELARHAVRLAARAALAARLLPVADAQRAIRLFALLNDADGRDRAARLMTPIGEPAGDPVPAGPGRVGGLGNPPAPVMHLPRRYTTDGLTGAWPGDVSR
jgi:hypothetical protein